jgi:hypothetical protein
MNRPLPPHRPAKATVEHDDRIDAAGLDSFPASDPPAWWSGPHETANQEAAPQPPAPERRKQADHLVTFPEGDQTSAHPRDLPRL